MKSEDGRKDTKPAFSSLLFHLRLIHLKTLKPNVLNYFKIFSFISAQEKYYTVSSSGAQKKMSLKQ